MNDRDHYTEILYPKETRSGLQTAPCSESARERFASLRFPQYHVIERHIWTMSPGGGHGSRTRLRYTKVSPSWSQPSQMKFLQQLVSKRNFKQSFSKHATSSPTERRPLEAAVAVLETEPPKMSLDKVADNLPQLDDDTLLCILQALTSPVALTKARMVSLLVSPDHPPHRLTVPPSDLQAAIRLWRCENPMDALGTRTVPTGAAAGLTQARYPSRRQRRTATAGRPEISPITQEYMFATVANSPDCQCPARTVSACPSVVCAEVAHY